MKADAAVKAPLVAGLVLATALAVAPRALPAASGPVTCSLSGVSTLDFGSITPLGASVTDVSPAFTITCSALKNDFPGGPAPFPVNLCASYNNGTGGASGGGNRQLLNGGNIALYDVYPTAAFGPTHWGSRAGTPTGTVVQASVTLVKPTGAANTASAPVSTNLSTFARLFGGQTTLPPGLYNSNLTLTVEAFWTADKSDCAAGGTPNTTTATQTAQVTYQKECRVGTVSTLDFGSSGFLTSNLDNTTTVSVTCTSTTAYKIGLDAGLGSGATTTNRKMTRTSAPLNTVGYSLFRDNLRTLNWGNDTVGGTDTKNGTGDGLAASHTIYGRVAPQTTPVPGSYQDTVVLSVVF